MINAVKTGLPAPSSPIEWATLADGILYTAQIPIKMDGTIESGDIRAQTRLTLDNLKRTIVAAGGTLSNVAQVLVYLPHSTDFPGMNEIYGQYFARPFPNRATIVAQLMVPGARIEIVAYAHIGKQKPRAVAGRSVARKVAHKTSGRPKK
jgi:2-iminobutanoate/2-iminopropanoate deaminase